MEDYFDLERWWSHLWKQDRRYLAEDSTTLHERHRQNLECLCLLSSSKGTLSGNGFFNAALSAAECERNAISEKKKEKKCNEGWGTLTATFIHGNFITPQCAKTDIDRNLFKVACRNWVVGYSWLPKCYVQEGCCGEKRGQTWFTVFRFILKSHNCFCASSLL